MAKLIHILIKDNNPNSFKEISVEGWDGRAILIPRSDIKSFSNHELATDTPALYLLFKALSTNENTVYIGQTRSLFKRLTQHDSSKDWDIALCFMIIGLNGSDPADLERECVKKAVETERYKVDNSLTNLSHAATGIAKLSSEIYLEHLYYLTSLLGYPVFEAVNNQKTGKFYFLNSRNNLYDAKGKLLDNNQFLVISGSKARLQDVDSFEKYIGSSFVLKKSLIAKNILRAQGSHFIFTKDYIFNSPSSAGDVVLGSSSNGWRNWKDENGKTLDENVRQQHPATN